MIVRARVSFAPQKRQSWFDWSRSMAIFSARNSSMAEPPREGIGLGVLLCLRRAVVLTVPAERGPSLPLRQEAIKTETAPRGGRDVPGSAVLRALSERGIDESLLPGSKPTRPNFCYRVNSSRLIPSTDEPSRI
jgi:hypothetical protein